MKYMLAGIVLFAVVLAAGCASVRSGHDQLRPPPGSGRTLACRLCYDETQRVFRFKSKVYKSRRSVYQTIKKHACPDCKTEAVFYSEDGRAYIKCAGCAPDGVPCDLCLPPKSKVIAPSPDEGHEQQVNQPEHRP